MEITTEERQVIIQWTKTTKLLNYAFSKGLQARDCSNGCIFVKVAGQWMHVETNGDIDEVCK